MSEQLELFTPSELEARPHGRKTSTTTDITKIDTERGRRECGPCEDENGVSFWDLLDALKRDGVTNVQFI